MIRKTRAKRSATRRDEPTSKFMKENLGIRHIIHFLFGGKFIQVSLSLLTKHFGLAGAKYLTPARSYKTDRGHRRTIVSGELRFYYINQLDHLNSKPVSKEELCKRSNVKSESNNVNPKSKTLNVICENCNKNVTFKSKD